MTPARHLFSEDLMLGASRQDPTADLAVRQLVLSDFPWSELKPSEFGEALCQLLSVMMADGNEAGDAFARALEGAEAACLLNVEISAEHRDEICQQIMRLRESASKQAKTFADEWLVWSLDALNAAVGRQNGDIPPIEEMILILRSARLAVEGYCVGRLLGEMRRLRSASTSIRPGLLN